MPDRHKLEPFVPSALILALANVARKLHRNTTLCHIRGVWPGREHRISFNATCVACSAYCIPSAAGFRSYDPW